MRKMSPSWCGSVDWVSVCKPKHCQFDSQSGHMPGLQTGSLVGGVREATHWCISHASMVLSLSYFLLSPLSKKKKRKEYICNPCLHLCKWNILNILLCGTLPFKKMNKLYFFRVVLGAQSNWTESTKNSHISSLSPTPASKHNHSTVSIPHHSGTLVTTNEPTLTQSLSPKVHSLP